MPIKGLISNRCLRCAFLMYRRSVPDVPTKRSRCADDLFLMCRHRICLWISVPDVPRKIFRVGALGGHDPVIRTIYGKMAGILAVPLARLTMGQALVMSHKGDSVLRERLIGWLCHRIGRSRRTPCCNP